MNQNEIYIDEVNQFSTLDKVALAAVGRYGKYQGHGYRLTIIKDLCFVNTWEDCSIALPAHKKFKYSDDNGQHIIDENMNKIDVKGIASFTFPYSK